MRDPQSADERGCRYIFTTVENFGKLASEVADVGVEVVALPHFDREEVVVVLLGLLAGGPLSDERFSYLLEVVKRR